MNEEMKELLNNFKEHLEKNYQFYLGGAVDSTEYYMSCGDLKLLLDYITNLQEENERLKKIEKFKFTLRKDETKAPIVIRTYEQQFKDYKSRNEKAREMIRFIAYNSERPLTMTELNKVYNILQGGDKE